MNGNCHFVYGTTVGSMIALNIDNLSQEGDCQVYYDAQVRDGAQVRGNAWVYTMLKYVAMTKCKTKEGR